MGLVSIARAEFDVRTMVLSFDARAMIGTCPTTIISSVQLSARPSSETALRWAILGRVRRLAA
ncbi:hypothetical protein [Devosia sp.]|uniref:hypothetical protein n=1 Tax=Devosia sp. TaxID=1871048 RepID=UPI00326789B9